MPDACGVKWSLYPLGREKDVVVAVMAGVSPSTVAKARRSRGIPPFTPRPPHIDWDAVDLGERTDAEIAAEYGVTGKAVSLQRWRRGIPPMRSPTRRRPSEATIRASRCACGARAVEWFRGAFMCRACLCPDPHPDDAAKWCAFEAAVARLVCQIDFDELVK